MNFSAPSIFTNSWKPLLVILAVGVLYARVLAKLGIDCWADENYSHALLVPFVIGFIIWSEFDTLKKTAGRPAFLLGGLTVVFAMIMLLGGTLGAELFTQRVSFALMLAGVVLYFFGTRLMQLLVVPFVLLLLSIPIPQIVFNKIAFPLQIWASQAAVWGIRLFEVPTVRKGNVIDILPRGAQQVISLEVVEACSGIRSLMTLVTLALILAYFTREKRHNAADGWMVYFKSFDFWRTLILMAAAIPIAVLTNAARVTATGYFTYTHGKKATDGGWHDASGWLVYVVALVLLILVNFGLRMGYRKFLSKEPRIEVV
jgi:exosortase